MKFYYLKIKYQQLTQSSIEDSQMNKKFRIKPNQFKREDIIIFDIPASIQPYRIPGTHIGILSDIPLNTNKQLNSEHLDSLESEITQIIEQIKQLALQSKTDDFQFDIVQIPEQQLSHKQQMQLLNELVSLRSVIRKKTGFQNQWIEILYDAYRAVNVSGFGYHKDHDISQHSFNLQEPTPQHLLNHSINQTDNIQSNNGNNFQNDNPNRNSSLLQDISINQNLLSHNESINNSITEIPAKQPLINRETSPPNSPDKVNLSGVRPPREYIPIESNLPRSPKKYEDQHKLTLSQFALESQALKQTLKNSQIPKTDQSDPKFSHIASKYDKYVTESEQSLQKLAQNDYESAYQQHKIRGEIVHFDRNFVQINREAVIGANEYQGETGVQSRLAKSQNEVQYTHSIDQSQLQQRILAQKLAQKAMNGDYQALKQLRELSEQKGNNPKTYEEIVRGVNQQMEDEGVTSDQMDYMKYISQQEEQKYYDDVMELDEETRKQIVDLLVERIVIENPRYFDSQVGSSGAGMADTAPEVSTSITTRPRTARKSGSMRNSRQYQEQELDDFSNYETVGSQVKLAELEDAQDTQSQSLKGQEEQLSNSQSQSVDLQKDKIKAPKPQSKVLKRTITKKEKDPPIPIPQTSYISFDESGMRSMSTTINGKQLILPSITKEFKDPLIKERDEFLQTQIDDANVGEVLSVNKAEKTYMRDFCSITDSIFQELFGEELSKQLNEAGMLLAKEAGISVQ
ncbi:hypothetical protein SS50377_22440 [Spironucleus salmonicida]|uniref:Uncharacterized protein n=1 Tax=Spironucleus salmonicida TaxID=348837 RepID=V6LMX5_9EUKA|nr:hypothetical protein SS50377_22440 [Spironucleus salmonicida]|eukprot:EST42069.1 Hypothetical protein SS50377_18376 [Spironucleus salmonicida]